MPRRSRSRQRSRPSGRDRGRNRRNSTSSSSSDGSRRSRSNVRDAREVASRRSRNHPSRVNESASYPGASAFTNASHRRDADGNASRDVDDYDDVDDDGNDYDEVDDDYDDHHHRSDSEDGIEGEEEEVEDEDEEEEEESEEEDEGEDSIESTFEVEDRPREVEEEDADEDAWDALDALDDAVEDALEDALEDGIEGDDEGGSEDEEEEDDSNYQLVGSNAPLPIVHAGTYQAPPAVNSLSSYIATAAAAFLFGNATNATAASTAASTATAVGEDDDDDDDDLDLDLLVEAFEDSDQEAPIVIPSSAYLMAHERADEIDAVATIHSQNGFTTVRIRCDLQPTSTNFGILSEMFETTDSNQMKKKIRDQLHSTIHGRPVRCCEWNKLEVARYRDLGPPIGGNSNNNQIGTSEAVIGQNSASVEPIPGTSRENMPPNDRSTESCVICLKKFYYADVVTRLNCSHVFHAACAKKALEEKASCPICRGCAACHVAGSFEVIFEEEDDEE